MMKNRYNLTLILCFTLSIAGWAQSAHWAISPTYLSISRFSSNLFKVRTTKSVALCDMDEKEVVFSVDSISNLVNGFALATQKSGDKYKIVYVVKENGMREIVQEELYIGDFSFFSENLCPVVNKKGKYGYINTVGELVIPCSYTVALPFSNGRAIATTSLSLHEIDPLLDQYKQSLNLTPADEKAMHTKLKKIITKSIHELDNKGNKLQGTIPDISIKNLTDSYSSIMNKQYAALPDSSYQLFSENKEYGYKKNGVVILPAQFIECGTVADDCAIVMVDHRYGVVKFNSANITCNVSESEGKLKAEATVPSIWENRTAKFYRIINDASRKEYIMSGTSIQRTLEADVASESGKAEYELACEKLVLWRTIKNISIEKRTSISATGQGISISAPTTVQANTQNVCTVKMKVSNHGSTSRTIKISLSTGQNSSIKLGAGKVGYATVNVPITKDTKCKITATANGTSSSCTTNLKAKFIL